MYKNTLTKTQTQTEIENKHQNQIKQRRLKQLQNLKIQMLKKSTSMHGILYGENALPHCSHYIDSLQRFQRDFAKHDKTRRNVDRHNKDYLIEQRRKLKLQRENFFRLEDQQTKQKIQKKFQNSRYLFDIGMKKTAHSPGLAFNPITLQYHNNISGYNLQQKDNKMLVYKLARSNNLADRGSSGFNVINGYQSVKVADLVPKDLQENFKSRVQSYKQKISLRH